MQPVDRGSPVGSTGSLAGLVAAKLKPDWEAQGRLSMPYGSGPVKQSRPQGIRASPLVAEAGECPSSQSASERKPTLREACTSMLPTRGSPQKPERIS